ncbi:Complement C3 [Nibea albiflora]|uniref:Complement C3 n=1 Tax=Nibea albiflora TaxID=240163 RepID=A0ACB7FLM0_NIBAL|nr:Complement C3 [Nibea albiflora]
MSAPNVLRVGTQENIFVECQTCGDGDRVEIKVMNHPTKAIRLTSTTIPADDFSKDRNVKQYVYLQAKFPHVELEKVVLVSFRSDYIFIQTDKTLYTPNSIGSEMVEAELRGIQIVTSPYTIHFRRTPKYFKPGMTFEILILSRGQLVKYGQYMTRALTSMSLLVTKELLPSFRIVAYYFRMDNEVVADSVWVDVEDSCMGSLKLESVSDAPSYRPGKLFDLKVTGDPGATVALVAVDKGVYVLNNKHRLTQKKAIF